MKKIRLISGLAALVFILVHCSKNTDVIANLATTDTTTNPTGVTTNAGVNGAFTALPLAITAPADNPQTAQKIALGKMLFWDPILSGNKDIACGTCHHPSLGFGDALDLSIGVNGQGLGVTRHFLAGNTIPFAKRNALSIINTAFNGIAANGAYNPTTAPMFFDNRSQSLELQSLEPMKSMEEMRGTNIAAINLLDSVVLRLNKIPQYVQLFTDAFQTANPITTQNLGKAVASYERTIIANNSPYDQYIRGNPSAMTTAQIQGMNLFASDGCIKCHSGPMFSDFALHVLSVPDNTKLPTDAGANGTYAFRTPTLRNLSLTGPYMHSGVFVTLGAVMNFYDQVGGGRSQNANVANNRLDADLRGLNDRNQNAIIQFLNALNDGGFDRTIPTVVPSGLHPGGNL
jgi:cytochrome c peroxidase